jgi:hypothetical protein
VFIIEFGDLNFEVALNSFGKYVGPLVKNDTEIWVCQLILSVLSRKEKITNLCFPTYCGMQDNEVTDIFA